MHPINLLYARKDVGGGSTSFTVHLYRAMQLAGIPVTLYRFHKARRSTLADYAGVPVQVVTPSEALKLYLPHTLLVAPEHSKHLPDPDILQNMQHQGMRLVVHDPNEFKVFDHLGYPVVRPICIRPTMQQFYKDAVFIPHPYIRVFGSWQGSNFNQRRTACTLARLTFVKRPQLLLQANQRLPRNQQITFFGAENRLATFVLKKQFPAFQQGGYGLPLQHGVSAVAASHYKLMVDMTYFPSDGGGSQYTFMEAWDAGCVVVVHRDWLRYPGEMQEGVNCVAIDDADHLANVIRNAHSNLRSNHLRNISKAGLLQLVTEHDPITVAKQYYKELCQ